MHSTQLDRPAGSAVRAGRAALAVLDAWGTGIVVLDSAGRVTAVNAAWERCGGLDGGAAVLGEDYLAARDLAALDDPAAAEIVEGIRGVLVGAAPEFSRSYAGSGPKEQRWFRVTVCPILIDGGVGVYILHEDITDRLHREAAGVSRDLVVDEVDAAVMATNAAGVITAWSKGAERLYGWSAIEAVGRHGNDVVRVAGAPSGARGASDGDDGEVRGGDVTATRRDGSTVVIHVRNVVVRDADGLPSGMVAIAVDRSEQVAADQQAQVIANTIGDGLCILDRHGFVISVNRPGRRMIRASYSEPLHGSFRHWIHGLDDGQPWQVAFPDTGSRPVTCQLVRQDGTEIPIEFVATALRAGQTKRITGWVVAFRDITETRSREDALARQVEEVFWLGRIRDSLAHSGFELYAQPIVDATTRQTVQHEILLRMRDPEDPEQVMPPGLFLPIAEKLGLAPDIDRWVVHNALQLAAPGQQISINISAQSLDDPSFASFIEDLLAETGADPTAVVFEITETALLDGDATARDFAVRIRAAGCGLALDDFGTGYGGFSYLKRFPLDCIKIDIEFVRDVLTNPASRHVVAAVVSLASAFGLRTVAEGVEDEATFALLQTMGVAGAQGYLFGRPAPAATVFAGANERKHR